MRNSLLCGLGSVLLLSTATNWAALPAHPKLRHGAPGAWVRELAVDLDAAAAAGAAQGAAVHYLLLDRQTQVDGVSTARYQHIVTRVDTQAGLEQASQPELSFDPAFQRVSVHHLKVYRGGRWRDRLDQVFGRLAQRESDFSRRLYDGSLSLLLVMSDVQVGDVISFAYTVEGSNPVFGGRLVDSYFLGWSVPVDRIRIRVLHRDGEPLWSRVFGGLELAPERASKNGWTELVWDLRELPPIEEEALLPAEVDLYPWLQLSQFASWREVVEWARPLYARANEPKAEIQTAAAELTAGLESDEERALALIRWVQDAVRYFGIVLGPNSHAPHQPREILERRFGDCKDSSLLLVSLLEAAGYRAWPVLVDSYSGRGVHRRLPSPGVFDHVVVTAEVGELEVWVDPTLSLQGGELADLAIPDYGEVLVIRDGVAELQRLPDRACDPGAAWSDWEYDFLGDGSAAAVTVTTTFSGFEADEMRLSLADISLEELADQYLDYYSGGPGLVRIAQPLELEDDRGGNRLRVVERYILEDRWRLYEGRERFALLPLLVDEVLPAPQTAGRDGPVDLPRRMRRRDRVLVRLPEGAALEVEEQQLVTPWFRYKIQRRGRGRRPELECEIKVGRHAVDSADLDEFNVALERLNGVAPAVVRERTFRSSSGERVVAWGGLLFVFGCALLVVLVVGTILLRLRLV